MKLIKQNNKLKASKLILYYSYQDYFVWLIKDMRRNELIKEINSLYKGDIDDIDELREKLKSEVDELKDKNKIIKEYLKSISEFENIFQNDGYYLFSSNYNENAFLIGYLFLKPFLNKYNQNFDSLKISLKENFISFNEAINGFKELSNEWRNVYYCLKNRKSDSDWVNKFFTVDLPKNIY